MRVSRTSFLGLVFAVAAFQGQAALASTITWQSPTNETGNASDIVTLGTLWGAATSGATTTVNGVQFQGYSGTMGTTSSYGTSGVTVNNLTVGSTTEYSNMPGGWDSDYAGIVGAGGYGPSGNVVSIVLTGLTSGETYEVQIFEPFWDNNWGTNFTGGSHTSGTLNQAGAGEPGTSAASVPQYVTGKFTASGTTQTITLSSPTSWIVFGSMQVRDVTGTTPEPSSLALLGTGVLGLAGTLRRRRSK